MSEDAIEFIVVQGERPTEEEGEEIRVEQAKKAVRACAARREEKWLALSKKETLTPEEQEWFDKMTRRKKGIDTKPRQKKWLFLKSKDSLTEEEREWLEKEERRREKTKAKAKVTCRLRKEKLATLPTKEALTPEEEKWLKKQEEKAKKVRERDRERGARKNQAKREKRKALMSKESLTEEERVWLEKEISRMKRSSEKSLAWNKRNPEKVRQNQRAHDIKRTLEQKAKDIRKSNECNKRRRKRDPAFACLMVARARMGTLLRGIKKERSARVKGSFFAYFGCDEEAFVAHIESKFRGEMSWANQAKVWHLDHIVPISVGLRNQSLLMRLNHYKNLQPLTIEENYRKSDSLPEVWPEGVPFTREEVLESVARIDTENAIAKKYLSESAHRV